MFTAPVYVCLVALVGDNPVSGGHTERGGGQTKPVGNLVVSAWPIVSRHLINAGQLFRARQREMRTYHRTVSRL
jgi:hypothetical protein